MIHAPTTSGLGQVIRTIVKLHIILRKGANKAVKGMADLHSLYTALEMSTLVQGSAEILDEDV